MKKYKFFLGAMALGFQMCLTFPALAGQWHSDENGWKYETDTGGYIRNGWFKEQDGKWYFFGSDGYMRVNTMTDMWSVLTEHGFAESDRHPYLGRDAWKLQ